jgi:hypothetical protein
MATDIKLKDFILYNCTSIKKVLKKKGLIILNVTDNIKWKKGCCISTVPIRDPPLLEDYVQQQIVRKLSTNCNKENCSARMQLTL